MRAPGKLVLLALTSALVLAGCGSAQLPGPTPATGTLEVRAVAGPVCPVETEPPDPACEPRPVAGARVLVAPADGRDIIVADGVTDAEGIARIDLPPGAYLVHGADVEGLMGRPEPMPVTIRSEETTSVTLTYDTGILCLTGSSLYCASSAPA